MSWAGPFSMSNQRRHGLHLLPQGGSVQQFANRQVLASILAIPSLKHDGALPVAADHIPPAGCSLGWKDCTATPTAGS